MDNANQPRPPEKPNAVVLALEDRIEVLERQMAERQTRADAGANERPLHRTEVSAELARHRDQLRDYEKALVERIADVDDDRRATTSRLQRAWQTQREEIDDRLRRHAGLMSGLLLLFVVLVAVALFLGYRQATSGRTQVAEQVAEIRQGLDRVSQDDALDEPARDELVRLSAAVGDIESSLERLKREREQAVQAVVASALASRDEGEARRAAEIGEMASSLERLEPERDQAIKVAVTRVLAASDEADARRAAEIGEIAKSLGRLEREREQALKAAVANALVSRDKDEVRRAAEMRRLDAEQRRLAEAVESLRVALGRQQSGPVAESGGTAAAVPDAAEPERDASPGLHADAAGGVAAAEDVAAVEQEVDESPSPEGGGSAVGPEGRVLDATEVAGQDAEDSLAQETLVISEGGYALQLIGFFSRESLAAFAAREGLPARAYYLRGTHKGRSWYAMVHSLHDTYDSAVEALSRLPENLVALNPWIRPVPEGARLRVLETGPER